MNMNDETLMRAALEEAADSGSDVPVGCVIEYRGKIIARAHNMRETGEEGAVFAHAEMLAMRKAAKIIGSRRLALCRLFVTLEPCPMCAGAMMLAGIGECVFGAYDQAQGCCGSVYDLPEDGRFYHTVPCSGGVLEKECALLLSEFFKDRRTMSAGEEQKGRAETGEQAGTEKENRVWKTTQRLILREFSPDDFDDVHAYASDMETVRHMAFGPNTPEETRDYLERQCVEERGASPRMHYNFAVQRRDTGRVIGGVSLHLNWRRDDAVLGGVIRRGEAGRGFMTEALCAVTEIAFREMNLHRLYALCAADNAAMAHVLEKCGFRNEGRLVRRGKSRPDEHAEWFDQFEYAMLRDEYLQRFQKEHT